MTFPETTDTFRNTRYNNNIAWKNVNSVVISSGGADTRPFTVRNTLGADTTIELRLTDRGAGFLGQGGLLVDLGLKLFEAWLAAGQPGQGIQAAGGTTIRIFDLTDARIGGLPPAKDGIETVNLTFSGNTNATPGTFAIDVKQFGIAPDPATPQPTPIVSATDIASVTGGASDASKQTLGATAPNATASQLVDLGGVTYSVTIK